MIEEVKSHHHGKDEEEVEQLLLHFKKASIAEKAEILRQLKKHSAETELTKKERKGLKKFYKTELVKRSVFLKIIAAWIITVPVSGAMAAMIYFVIRGMMPP